MPKSLADVVAALERLAPPALAEDWDNVGLLVDRLDTTPIRRCLLTIDLTEAVVDDAIAGGHELIVAYHPPLFAPVRRLSARIPKDRALLLAIRAGIAIYAPHTALDAVRGGVNDWLADGLLDTGPRRATTPAPPPFDDGITGPGRVVTLAHACALTDVVDRIKAHLRLDRVRVAATQAHAAGRPIRSVAICAGAGGSVLAPVTADLLWTGEMRHHDVVAALDRGASVVLCDHTNTERGYLPVLRERLDAELDGELAIHVSAADAEPLRVV